MREDKVLTACMDINLLTQVLLGHDRALNMPARTALAPWGLPVRLAFFFRLPENEIGRILFVFLTGYLQFTKACGWVVAGFTFMSAISFLHSAM